MLTALMLALTLLTVALLAHGLTSVASQQPPPAPMQDGRLADAEGR